MAPPAFGLYTIPTAKTLKRAANVGDLPERESPVFLKFVVINDVNGDD